MLKKLKFTLKTPVNLSYLWNLGSLLGLLIIIQIISGILLTLYYESSEKAFQSLWNIHLNTNNGYLLHLVHLNCSSFLFLFMYLHILKGFIFSSFISHKLLWVSGFVIMILMMAESFMGYVLPWGQMSLWGATVITNLVSVVPLVGKTLVELIWGGFFVSTYSMKLFFSLHFLLPMLLMVVMVIHIIILHFNGSSNPLGSFLTMKIEFLPSFLYKDMLNILIIFMIMFSTLKNSYYFSDPENFIQSNPMVSPIHIQPEWYFLNYYCILRAIPSKLGGVILFVMSLVMILAVSFVKSYTNLHVFKCWMFYSSLLVVLNLLLIWLGSCLMVEPYLVLSKIFTFSYFLWFILLLFL